MRAVSSSSTERPKLEVAHVASDEAYVQRFGVTFEYPVYFTSDAFAPRNDVLVRAASRLESDRKHRFVAVVDDGVASARPDLVPAIAAYARAHDAVLSLVGEPDVVPGGERAKVTEDVYRRVLETTHAKGLDRKSFVLIVGGGAVQDAAGYAASIAHRGLRVVRMPTTVESQCDSGVGVKNAINAFSTKNYVGTFAPPFAVINDRELLATLSARDFRAGMAEAVKVALLRDASFFDWLWRNAERLAACDRSATDVLVRRTAELHMQHIAGSGDPFEHGAAKPLDYGHWAAHKLESLSQYELRHGEAVAIGLAIDTRYAAERGVLPDEVVARVCVLLERLGFTLWHSTLSARNGDGRRVVLAGLEEFREHLGGNLVLTLLRDVGQPLDADGIDEARMERAIAWLEYRSRAR
jgi:3-dehydroquinate synthase